MRKGPIYELRNTERGEKGEQQTIASRILSASEPMRSCDGDVTRRG